MSISSSTLTAIQKVGAAAFAADDKLKKEVQSYAERVNLAMLKNPYNLGNDALIDGWKAVARLSQTMMGIEQELKNIYRIASELTQDDQPSVRDMPALAAPVAKKKAKKIDAAITTVKVKGKGKAKKAVPAKPVAATAPAASVAGDVKTPAKRPVAKKAAVVPATAAAKVVPVKKSAKSVVAPASKVAVKTVPKPKKTEAADKPVQTQDLKGNSAKLMAQLQGVLTTSEFTGINQSAVAKLAGIPVGSMAATIGRLVKAGRIVGGSGGSLKLTATQAAAPSTGQAGAQQPTPVTADSAAQ
jgi:hypothetical protein